MIKEERREREGSKERQQEMERVMRIRKKNKGREDCKCGEGDREQRGRKEGLQV